MMSEPLRIADKCVPTWQWYATEAWQKLREFVFVRDNFRCAECKKVIADKTMPICDHRRPHQGQPALFWSIENLITVCADCHDGVILLRKSSKR
jgi:5-methylcytosine-specific restriction enzyme A